MRCAFSMRVTQNAAYPDPRDALSHDWVRWCVARGWEPVLVPNGLPDPGAYVEGLGVDLVVLTNGDSIGPLPAPGEEAAPAYPREHTETRLLEWGLARDRPVLGVCRGHQMVNRYFGGRVVEGLQAEVPGVRAHVAPEGHPVEIVDARLRDLCGAGSATVNSFHDDGFLAEHVAPELRVFALAGDGVVEGLYHPARPLLTVQWHPERRNPGAGVDERLIDALVAGRTLAA